MKRITGALLTAVMGICGCVSAPETGGGPPINYGRGNGPPTVPGMMGPGGAPVQMCGPYDQAPPAGAYQAQMMMRNSVPLSAVQMNQGGGMAAGFGPAGAGPPPTMMPRGGMMSPIGIPFAPGVSPGPNVPMGPGMPGGPGMPPGGPGMPPGGQGMPPGGPGLNPAAFMKNGMNPGVVTANVPPGGMPGGGVTTASYGPGKVGFPFTIGRTQVKFTRPTGMRISWYTQGPDGKPMWSTTPIETPGRYNFTQAAIYRLKLTGIEGRPGLELYPTLEVVPCNPNTEAFLAHSSVPVEFTNDDFKQVAEGNYIVKVIYLPFPQFQDAAGTGTDEILSTRLEPGANPIEEACRRGNILLVIRMGNVDQEAPNTPPLNAPGPGLPHPIMPPPMAGPNLQVPMYGMPGMQLPPPPPPLLPPANMKDPGKASTGVPGAPINVPSVPLPGAGGPGAVDTNALPLPALPPGLDGKKNMPAGPTATPNPAPPAVKGNGPGLPPVPGEPVLKDAIKLTPEVTPKAPLPPAGKTADDALPALPTPPASAAPVLPVIPPPADLPGPQTRQRNEMAPSAAQLIDQLSVPRR